MKKFIILFCILAVTAFIPLVTINYFIDSAGVFHSEEMCDFIIKGFKQGKNVTNVSNLNERLLKEKFVELHKGESFDYIIIGASRVMTISTDVFKDNTILNLGMSGSKIEDLIAIVELCKENSINYNKIIIGVEPTLFNADDDDTRWRYLKKYYYSFLQQADEASFNWDEINNLFSISYFQSNIKALPHKIKGEYNMQYVTSVINDGMTDRTDGSIYYAKSYRDRAQDIIDRESKTWTHSSFLNYNNISTERLKLFDLLVQSLNESNRTIIFYKCPYHPYFYSRIMDINGIKEGEKNINKLATFYSIPSVGSYDPFEAGFENTDFYDAAHVRKEALDSLLILYFEK